MLHVVLCAAALMGAASKDDSKERPNVVFLFLDDLRPDAIGALGNPVVQSPNIDRLIEHGFRFNNAYCMGANVGAVCRPSRNMLLSGRAYFRFEGNYASAKKPNWPTTMKDAGYATFHCGKRGNVAVEIEKKFDSSNYLQDEKDRTSGQMGRTVVDTAIDWLSAKKGKNPYFMYLAFEGPHDPRVADEEYRKLYEEDSIPLPKNYLPVHPFDNGEMTVRDERLNTWPRSEADVRRHLHDYYACITALDYHIGRLITELKARGDFENTIFIFSADHGLAIGSHGLMGKQSLYDHSMKAPLVFVGPGIPEGESDALVYLLDIYPTVCDLVGIPKPKGIDGKSLAPIIDGKEKSVRDTLFLSYRDVQRAVRDGRWKLIRYPKVDQTQLFDLTNDPNELHNLADDPSHKGEVARLWKEMEKWQQQLGDKAPLKVENPKDPTFTPPKD